MTIVGSTDLRSVLSWPCKSTKNREILHHPEGVERLWKKISALKYLLSVAHFVLSYSLTANGSTVCASCYRKWEKKEGLTPFIVISKNCWKRILSIGRVIIRADVGRSCKEKRSSVGCDNSVTRTTPRTLWLESDRR